MVVILGARWLLGSDRLLRRKVLHKALPRRSTVRNDSATVITNKLILAALAKEIHRCFHLGVAYYLWRWWRNVYKVTPNGWMRDFCRGYSHIRLWHIWVLAGLRFVYGVDNKRVIVWRTFGSESVQILLVYQTRLHAQRIFYATLWWDILNGRTHGGNRQGSHLTLLVENWFRKFKLFEIVVTWDPLLDLPDLVWAHHPAFIFASTVNFL